MDERIRARVNAIASKVSQTVVLRRVTRTSGPNPAVNPPNGSSFTLAVSAMAGDSTISISAADVEGRLAAGDILVITGDNQAYTVLTATTAVAGVFSSIPISPILAASAALGAGVTARFAADTSLRARVGAYPARMVDGSSIKATDLMVTIPGEQLSSAPSIGDLLLIGSDIRMVQNVSPEYVQDEIGLWRVQAR